MVIDEGEEELLLCYSSLKMEEVSFWLLNQIY
jgi:hypothetical protein